MNLSEQIEALQKDWQKRIRNHFLAIKGKYCPHARKAISECVSELAPVLAAAREQAEELAAMKEQHSADLREVAEMALRMGMCDPALAQLVSGADRVLAAFCEKKAKVGK